MERVIQSDYHLQLVATYENGHTGYSTFGPDEWLLALDRFTRETQDFEVIEARLILHLQGSVSNDDHVVILEYYR